MALGTIDIVLLVLSLLSSAAIGIYHGVKGIKQTPEDYLLGGRAMKPLPLAMSLTVGTLSAITIMGNAGEVYSKGTQIWMMDIGLALGLYFVAKVFIPVFYPLKMISVYHYIEYRFQSTYLRKATVVLTLGGAYLFLGFLLYPPSLILQVFTGLTPMMNVVIAGLTCSLYSAFGGVKGVVYTDVLQAVIMMVGSLAIVIQGANNVGGFGEAWDKAYHHGRIEFFNFDLDPYQRHSFWLTIVYGFLFSLSTYGVNQSQTQRTFSTGSVAEAQKVIYYAIVGILFMKSLINLSGITIFANYVDCDPLTKKNPLKPEKDLTIVIIYVTQYLTKIPGLAGLFVASIYAAVLSSVSTQVNSITALLWEDFLKPLSVFKTWDDIKVTRFQKLIVLVSGIIGIGMSVIVDQFGSFLSSMFLITGAIWGPMIGLFLVAVYLPWVNAKSATTGFIVGILFSITIALGQTYTQPDPVNLSLSHAACPLNESLTMATNSSSEQRFNYGEGIFGISYCLNHCWGTISCIVTVLILTPFIGWNNVDEVKEELINPMAWRWFSRGLKKSFQDLATDCRRFFSKSSSSDDFEKNNSPSPEPEEKELVGFPIMSEKLTLNDVKS